MTWEIPNVDMQAALCVLYAVCSASFFMIVVFAIIIVVVYLRRLSSVSWMVKAFYVLTILQATAHGIFFYLLARQPTMSPFYYGDCENKDTECSSTFVHW